MTQKELIEIIQQHHPNHGETVIRKALNRAQDDFSAKTDIIYAVADNTLATDQRFYDLDPGMLEVKRVEINGNKIRRLVNHPKKGDLT